MQLFILFFLCYFIFFIILFNLFTLTVKFAPLKVGTVKITFFFMFYIAQLVNKIKKGFNNS